MGTAAGTMLLRVTSVLVLAAAVQSTLAAVQSTLAAVQPSDLNYEAQFEDVIEEFDDPSHRLKLVGGPIPEYLRGQFLQVGPGRWCWNQRCVTHALDGYSKLHQFDFQESGVGFKSTFLKSGFHEASRELNDIAYNVMAQKCEPPLNPLGFFKAPNDNNNVNVYGIGDSVVVMSDTPTLVQVQQVTLNTTHEFAGSSCLTGDNLACTPMSGINTPPISVASGGTAHPHRLDNGDYLTLYEVAKIMGRMEGPEGLGLYRMSATKTGVMEEVFTIPVDKAAYTHSFGLAKAGTHVGSTEHVIIVQQPIHYNLMALMASGTLQAGFVNDIFQKENFIHVAPVHKDGDKHKVTFKLPRFFFGHVLNSFARNSHSFVIDVNMQNDIFFDRYSLDVQRNKTLRDSWPTIDNNKDGLYPGWQTVMRIELDTNTGAIYQRYLFGNAPKDNMAFEHDLFKLHPDDMGREYCGYWALQSHARNSTSFASAAIVRADICAETPHFAATWYRANVYPGEPTFVPKPGSPDKTEGTVVFKAWDGNAKQSLLLVCDAKTLATISEAVLPIPVPFTVHGDFFASK